MASSSRWADLRLRAISAAVLIPLALGALWLGGWPWVLVMGAATGGLSGEWWTMCHRRRSSWTPALVGCGLLYVLLAWVCLQALRAAPGGFSNVLFLLLLVWATDIGAYLAGRLLGGPKLAPAISPGKTWTGAAGGLAAALCVGLAFGAGASGLLAAAGLSVASQLGDLAESAAKRYFGVKDSGQTIPGHGGLFDRLDGLLAAAPVAALLVFGHGEARLLWQ